MAFAYDIMEVEYQVLPVFSTPIGVLKVNEDLSHLNNGSNDTKLLNSFSKEKDILMSYFNYYKNNILRLENQDFELTTSWLTNFGPGEDSGEYHYHGNSLYSCVFYFDSFSSDEGGEIEFKHPHESLFELKPCTEINLYNASEVRINPEKNMLVIFPSRLYHKILTNRSSRTRNSLAFNIFPVGIFGGLDSEINLKVDKP